MKKNFFQEGQSLWEVIIAITITALVALGLVRASTIAVKSSRFASDQSRLTALAQQSIAQAVDWRNSNPADFWLYGVPSSPVTTYSPTEKYCYRRQIQDQSSEVIKAGAPAGSRMALITVDIYWDEKAGVGTQCYSKNFSHSMQFNTYVTN